MSEESIEFEFLGFEPESRLRTFLSILAESLSAEAPSDSLIKIGIQKMENSMKASCRIVSIAGVFCAEAIHNNPQRAFRRVEKKIRRQLKRWKKYRFDTVRKPLCNFELVG